MSIFTKKTLGVVVAAAAISSQSALAAITYSSDFESIDTTGGDVDVENFKIGNIVNGGGGWFPGTFGAPANYNTGYSAIVDEGGAAQGNQQLSIFSDYNGWSPFVDGPGITLQTFVSQDMGVLDAGDVGETYTFTFDGKLGNIVDDPTSQAEAFIKVLKSSDGSFIELANITFDSDAGLTTDWSEGNTIDLLIDAGMVGELIQIGFNTTATDWAPSGVVYDNLSFSSSPVPVPAAAWLFGSALVGLAGIGRKRKA
jgi:hypothetical protein